MKPVQPLVRCQATFSEKAWMAEGKCNLPVGIKDLGGSRSGDGVIPAIENLVVFGGEIHRALQRWQPGKNPAGGIDDLDMEGDVVRVVWADSLDYDHAIKKGPSAFDD